MKILFVTNRNIVNTCGELRLIKNRAISLYSTYGIKGDFLVFRNDRCDAKPQEDIGAESTLKKFLYSTKRPFSVVGQYKNLKSEVLTLLDGGEYSAVVLSGNLVLRLSKIIKKKHPKVKLIMDIHGAIEELIEFKGNTVSKKLFRRAAYIFLKSQEKHYIKNADAYFAVSEALKEYLIKEYNVADKQFFIAPCAQGMQVLDPEEKKRNRAIYRAKYGVSDDEKLFIYSGGLSPWQCVDETVKLFSEVSARIGKSKLLLLTGDRSAIEKYQSDNIIVDSLPFNLVNETICAGDFAFMLRQNFITNNVAYPNKFIEYVASGMKVIATPFVNDVASQINKYGVGLVLDELVADVLVEYVSSLSHEYMSDVDRRQELLDDVCFENRLKPVSEFIRGE